MTLNGGQRNGQAQTIANPNASRLSVRQLEARIGRLTELMYTTSVPLSTLEEEVIPCLSPDIQFVDPWVRVRGIQRFLAGLRGFHCVIRFDFDIVQLDVKLNEARDGGRAMVDGVMNLRQLRFYNYPLRTILVYDFVMTDGGRNLQITKVEEMWSLGDMLQNAPLIGRVYEVFRVISGYTISTMFWLACAISAKSRGSRPSR